MKKSFVTVMDQFCGAGGSSEGATNAGDGDTDAAGYGDV
jgi:site-specific DNA-cytosine methylase